MGNQNSASHHDEKEGSAPHGDEEIIKTSRVPMKSSKSKLNSVKKVRGKENDESSEPLLSPQKPMSLKLYLSDDEGTRTTVPHADDSFGSLCNTSFGTPLSPNKSVDSDRRIRVTRLNDEDVDENDDAEDLMIAECFSPTYDEENEENEKENQEQTGENSSVKSPVRKRSNTGKPPRPSPESTFKPRNSNASLQSRAKPKVISTRQISVNSNLTGPESLPGLFHGNNLNGTSYGDNNSMASHSFITDHSTDLESIANRSQDASLSDLSFSASIASLDLKRKKRRDEIRAKQENAIKKFHKASKRKNVAGRPNSANAFETLPKHLIKSALVRQAASTLKDQRFVRRRIVKLRPVRAAKVHVSDMGFLFKREVKDMRRRERKGGSVKISPSATFAEGEDATTVTLESFDIFQDCILELCGIQLFNLDLDDMSSGLVDENASSGRPITPLSAKGNTRPITPLSTHGGARPITPLSAQGSARPITPLPEISTSDGGKAIYSLGKFSQGRDWLEEAMDYYRCSLFLFLLELGVREPCLVDDSGDCTGFFYVEIANAGSTFLTSAHQDIAKLLTKMGDIHGKLAEINDALHAYRASQTFWSKFISETRISVEDSVSISGVDELNEHAAAVEGLALTYNRIGGVYCSRGELNSATESFHEALDMQIEALGPDHLEVAKTLHNIGVTHRHNNNLTEALHFYQKAHRIFELNLGKEHLDTVRTLHNIGGVYRRQRDFESAMECFRDVLRVRRALLGDRHPSVAITLVSIAAVLRRSGKKKEANRFYAEAMK